ncbi:MAG: AzlD domain-containing protein [Peptoniphilus sp.]|uniref:branched-chain amino acid transporter permease n=1 Tax=Peptoniphilus sp. TaxID=1971214 RepID=UPI0025CF73F5|nr:AzlD domain-containing protein [Peptoniphilus sp.]MCI5642959.1 AzlD domain-containing protein [Peptoniphilus sp.]MDD7352532.1 AzlD domain-containing protein [Peptoniphilaceae bacterium]
MLKYIFIAGLITAMARFLPGIIFRKRKLTTFIEYLGEKLPYSLMGLLLVFCIRKVNFLNHTEVIPVATSFAVIILSFKFIKNFFLSIALGTVLYMGFLYLI